MRPLILLTNDDGFFAPNLAALRAALAEHADVVVCAPEQNQSAASHSLSLHRPLRLRRASDGVFTVDGTPADTVYVALLAGARVLPRRPDLVVSGMNHGPNLGGDVFYSGTVAAAREGALRNIPAIAFSADAGADRDAAAALSARLAMATLDVHRQARADAPDPPVLTGAPRVPLFSVNIPRGSSWEVRPTRLGARVYEEDIEFRKDPRGKEYLWIGGSGVRHDHVPGSDTEAYDDGAVSVTPLSLDLFSSDTAPLAAALAAAYSPAASRTSE